MNAGVGGRDKATMASKQDGPRSRREGKAGLLMRGLCSSKNVEVEKGEKEQTATKRGRGKGKKEGASKRKKKKTESLTEGCG